MTSVQAILYKVGGRELPRQPKETEQQILHRRATLVCLGIHELQGTLPVAIGVMPYMCNSV